MTQAYRFALDPTERQGRALLRHAGAARVVRSVYLAPALHVGSDEDLAQSWANP
ncbi:helix-turn-helix domain-containing protein [Kitasatospora sp. NPDC001159]